MVPIANTHHMLGVFAVLAQFHSAKAARRYNVPHEVYNFQNETQSPQMPVPVPVPTQNAINNTITESVFSTESIYVTEFASASCPAPTTTRSVYSVVVPSPGASPIEITAQSQVITSYVPEMTWCVGPPLAIWAITTGPPYQNASTTQYTTSQEGTGSCSTIFAPVQTTVCATTLTGLGSKIPVTDCEQQITFSTECGFSLETQTPTGTGSASLITPAPSVRRLYTYWLAPWQAMTAGDTPSDVDVKICTEQDNNTLECIRYQEVWEVVVVTSTRTTERTIQVSTTVSGPGTLMLETMTSTITDTIESIDLSTVLLLETEVQTESISTARKPTATVRTTLESTTTVYLTKHLKHASSTIPSPPPRPTLNPAPPPPPSPTSSVESTTTVWVTSTSTVHITGTVTRRRPRPTPRRINAGPAEH